MRQYRLLPKVLSVSVIGEPPFCAPTKMLSRNVTPVLPLLETRAVSARSVTMVLR